MELFISHSAIFELKNNKFNTLENRKIFFPPPASTPASAPTPASTPQNSEKPAKEPESTSYKKMPYLADTVIFNTRNAIEQTLKGTTEVIHGAWRAGPSALWNWNVGNVSQLWNTAGTTITETAGMTKNLAIEAKDMISKPIMGIIGNTREKFSNLFSMKDTNWKNFIFKKSWQLATLPFAPAVGGLKGSYNYIAGEGEQKNVISRNWKNVTEPVGKIGKSVGESAKQIFYTGPFETAGRQAIEGITESTRGSLRGLGALFGWARGFTTPIKRFGPLDYTEFVDNKK